ncbi:MAG TPA: dephospho-CoA kinase, partial [Bacteroidia bacterium]|nr:dephospho-CoA kinase [Bacteroidia bacterium]
VTGGIGSGKTIVCSVFRHLGIPVYDADTEAKLLYEKYPDLREAVRNQVSEEVFDGNGKLDRKKLADIVFLQPEKLKVLNGLVHPLVKKDFHAWLKNQQDVIYVVKEAAILFESGADADCDKIITVISPRDLRIQRVRDRDRKTKSEVESIIDRQMNDEEKIQRSDFVIRNDEKELVLPQVLSIHESLVKGEKAVEDSLR